MTSQTLDAWYRGEPDIMNPTKIILVPSVAEQKYRKGTIAIIVLAVLLVFAGLGVGLYFGLRDPVASTIASVSPTEVVLPLVLGPQPSTPGTTAAKRIVLSQHIVDRFETAVDLTGTAPDVPSSVLWQTYPGEVSLIANHYALCPKSEFHGANLINVSNVDTNSDVVVSVVRYFLPKSQTPNPGILRAGWLTPDGNGWAASIRYLVTSTTPPNSMDLYISVMSVTNFQRDAPLAFGPANLSLDTAQDEYVWNLRYVCQTGQVSSQLYRTDTGQLVADIRQGVYYNRRVSETTNPLLFVQISSEGVQYADQCLRITDVSAHVEL